MQLAKTNNLQDYSYHKLWRLFLVVYIFLYNGSIFNQLKILYDTSFADYLIRGGKILWVMPNILDVNNNTHILMFVWLSIFVLSPFIYFRKTKFISSIILWYFFVCFIKINPLTSNIGIKTFLMVLVISAILPIPKSKTESVDGKNLYTSNLLYIGLWINYSLYYFYSGYKKLLSYAWSSGQALVYIDTHILFRHGITSTIYKIIPNLIKEFFTYFVAIEQTATILSLLGNRFRKISWFVTMFMQFCLLVFLRITDIQLIMFIYGLIVFNPAWIKPKHKTKEKLFVYYDGVCGFCHSCIKHIINIDHSNIFYYTPVQKIDNSKQEKILAIKVSTHDDKILEKSSAIIYIYRCCGGVWRIVAFIMGLVPLRIRDYFYDLVSKNRYKLGKVENNLCPILPEHLDYKFRENPSIS